MAKWRALHGSITTSPEIIRLTEFEQLLFTWMIPHADDWGVISGDPLDLKVRVMPASQRPLEDFERAVKHMEEVGLIWRYRPNGEGPLIQFPSWDTMQRIRADRRDDPRHTLYADWQAHVRQMSDGCQTSDGHLSDGCPPIPDIPDISIPDQTDKHNGSFSSQWNLIKLQLERLHDPRFIKETFTHGTGIKEVTGTAIIIQVHKGDGARVARMKQRIMEGIAAACPEWAEREVILEEA